MLVVLNLLEGRGDVVVDGVKVLYSALEEGFGRSLKNRCGSLDVEMIKSEA